MAEVEATFNCRYEELVPLAKLLRAHYLRDQSDFVDLLPEEYNAAFLTDYDARVAAADQVVSAQVGIGQGQALGKRRNAAIDQLPSLLDRLEARLRRVQGLTVPAEAFGISAVRRARAAGDVERLGKALQDLLANLTANTDALSPKGHTPTDTATFAGLRQSILADNTAQDVSQTTQMALTSANVATLNHLYAAMQEVLADGKSLYATTNSARKKDYTLTQLLKRVRREQGGQPGNEPT